jgi:hypothetical protein
MVWSRKQCGNTHEKVGRFIYPEFALANLHKIFAMKPMPWWQYLEYKAK